MTQILLKKFGNYTSLERIKTTISVDGGKKAKPGSKRLALIPLNKRIEKIKIISSTCVSSFVTSKTS